MSIRVLLALGISALLAVFAAGCGDNAGPSADEPGAITFSVYDLNTQQIVTPEWIAFQDGVDGDWTPLTGSSPYSVQVTDDAGAYGFAFVIDRDEESYLEIMHGTLDDETAVVYPVWIYDNQNYAVRGTPRDRTSLAPTVPAARFDSWWTQQGAVLNPPAGMDFQAYCDASGGGYGGLGSLEDLEYTWQLPAGTPWDAGYLLGDTSGDAGIPGCVYLRRGLNQSAGATLTEDIDFSPPYDGSKYTYQCTRQTFTVPGAGEFETDLHSVNGLELPLGQNNASTVTYFAPVPDALVETDRYVFWARNYDNRTSLRCIGTAPPASQTFIETFNFTLEQSDGILLQGLQHPDANLYCFWFYSSGWAREAGVCVTTAWLQAAGATDYPLPDFSGLDGWQSDWGQPVTAPLYYAGGEAVYCNGTPSAYLRSNSEPTSVGANFTSKYSWCDVVD